MDGVGMSMLGRKCVEVRWGGREVLLGSKFN